jgi:hypothetical protein
MAEFIEFLSPKALDELQRANAELVTMVANVEKVGVKMKTITTPTAANNATKDLTAKYLAQEKAIERLQKANEKARLSEIKLQQDREKAFDRYNATLAKEQAKLNASQSVYNKVQQKVNILTKTYNDLAIKRELGIQLSVKEEAQLLSLNERLNKYQSALKNVDASIQKNQRNVGNYAGSFNGLGNSINQITRELPAFTFSAQTGFLALSNNIPILTDEIGKLAAKNKELAAQGQPVKSVFSQILSGVFSLQTAMGVGILLFTVYGKEIVEFASNLFKTSKGIDAVKESQTQLNEVNLKGQKDAVQETVNVKALLAISQDQTLTMRERLIAVKELQDTYPAYFGNLTKEKILAGETALAEKELTEAILSRAKANAAVDKITENQGKIIDIEFQRLTLRKELEQVEKRIADAQKQVAAAVGTQRAEGLMRMENSLGIQRITIIDKINKLSGEKASLDKVNNNLTEYAIQKEKESILLKEKVVKVEKAENDEKRKQLKAIDTEIKGRSNLIDRIEAEIKLYEELRDKSSETSKKYGDFNKVVKALKQSLDLIKNPLKLEADIKGLEKQQKEIEKHKEGLKALNKELAAAYGKTFEDSFINSSGFKTTFDILNKNILGFGTNATVTALAISESFQEMYNFINGLSQENFDEQRERLRQETEIALAFAGDSASAQEEIRRQAEEKEKEIRRREFNAKKQQAKFNIGIDLAQAVMATFARLGFPAGVPLAAIMTAIGLAQIAAINSQEVPAFKDGGVHDGGLMLVNDAKGSNFRETIKTPDGKLYQPKERNVIMNAPKGTEIFTPDQWQKNLDSMLMSNNISYAQPNINLTADFDKVGSKIVNAINNKQEYHQTFDRSGIKNYISNGHTQKEILNNQVTFGR